ncbi:hypothetical protein ACP275_14G099500 [Erythranthe tilingii]
MGYGFVQYAAEGSAKKAIEEFNGTILNGKQVYVGPFLPKQERERLLNMTNSTNVYVKNFCESTTEYNLQNIFGEFGEITSKVIMRNDDGTSKCFGFVNFKNADAAARAIESLNGKKIDNKEWYVGIAQRKKDREAMLQRGFVCQQHQLVPGMIPNSFVPMVQQIVPRASEIPQPIPIGALTSTLANASPTEWDKSLGDNLYALVEQLEPEIAPRVTGLLLEMDQTEVLHLLESPEALKAAVAAAVEVLNNGAIG